MEWYGLGLCVSGKGHVAGCLEQGKELSGFLISNFRRFLNLTLSSHHPLSTLHPAFEEGTDRGFRNVGKSQSDAGEIYTQPLKMELTEGSETSANHNLTPGKYPKEYKQLSGSIKYQRFF
jgi:hypothetical protein